MRNIYAHRAQQVEAGRFPSEADLCTWLLEPFPFLLMGVYEADERHRLSTLFEETGSEPQESLENPEPQPQPQQADQPAFDTSINPLAPGAEGTITAL